MTRNATGGTPTKAISALAQRYTLLQSAMAGAERVFGLLDAPDLDCPPVEKGDAGDDA